jgi:type IX secretion system PorP/SprF family membrane protein
MKKIAFSIFIYFITSVNVNSQQLPISTQHSWNEYIVNPSFTGDYNYSPIQINYRKHWSGFKGAPSTYSIGGHTSINNNGIGGMIFQDDKGGAIKQTGLILNYSYKLIINKESRISFGLSGILNQYSYNYDNIVTQSINDLSLYSNSKTITPDLNFGVSFIKNNNLKIGVSINQLIESKLKNWNQTNITVESENRLIRHYFFNASYLIKINDKLEIQPYALIKTTFITPIQFDLSTKFIYNKNIFTSIGYRFKDAYSIMVGYKLNNFLLGYSYDINVSPIRKYSLGSHEIFLGYRINKKL